MYSILTLSRNTRVMLQRNDTLALAGYRVISPRDPDRAPLLAKEQTVDAVVIAQCVEPELRGRIIQELRQLCPQCAVVFVYTGPEQLEKMADVCVDVTDGNDVLISVLERNLHAQRSPTRTAIPS